MTIIDHSLGTANQVSSNVSTPCSSLQRGLERMYAEQQDHLASQRSHSPDGSPKYSLTRKASLRLVLNTTISALTSCNDPSVHRDVGVAKTLNPSPSAKHLPIGSLAVSQPAAAELSIQSPHPCLDSKVTYSGERVPLQQLTAAQPRKDSQMEYSKIVPQSEQKYR
ncbi:hypothetical protein Tco_0494550 [Tanacetum coccineum]